LLVSFLGVVNGQLSSTGIKFDPDAEQNGFIVYTSRIVLPGETTTLYPEPEHLLALAYQAYGDMIASCKANDYVESCPGAMTVFAIENEIHFGSSTKNRKPNGPSNPFYHAFLIDEHQERFGDLRSGPLEYIKRSMIQCQVLNRSELKPGEHVRGGRCGEFNAVLIYLLTRDNPDSVRFEQGSRILTVGRTDNDLNNAPRFFPPCTDRDIRYGCKTWVRRIGIGAPTALNAIPQADRGSRVGNVKLCQLSIAESQRFAAASDVPENVQDDTAGNSQDNDSDDFGGPDDDELMDWVAEGHE
jgi:hypothetical protein